MVLDKAPLPVDASIGDFQDGRASYMANAVEQALLLLGDMADLRSLRKYEVFLNLKRDLALENSLTGISLFLSLFFNNYICSFQQLHFFLL